MRRNLRQLNSLRSCLLVGFLTLAFCYHMMQPMWGQLEQDLFNQLDQSMQSQQWGQAQQIIRILSELYPSRASDWQDYRAHIQQAQRAQQTYPPPEQYPAHQALNGSFSPAAPTAGPVAVLNRNGRPFIRLPLFERPFAGEYPLTNGFDHDQDPGIFESVSGERVQAGLNQVCGKTDNHRGYDWSMPEGTVILAAAPGRVHLARPEANAHCPLLNQETQGLSVKLRHQVGELWFETVYAHLSTVTVQEGHWVQAGSPIGLSGNTGCSTGPHLHFEVHRYDRAQGRFVVMDPYGWWGEDLDPWAQDPGGMTSYWVWKAGEDPSIQGCLLLEPELAPESEQ